MAEIEVNPPRGIIGYISQFLTFLYILYLGLCWIIHECVIFAGGVLGTLLAPVFWLGHLPWRAVTAIYQIVEPLIYFFGYALLIGGVSGLFIACVAEYTINILHYIFPFLKSTDDYPHPAQYHSNNGNGHAHHHHRHTTTTAIDKPSPPAWPNSWAPPNEREKAHFYKPPYYLNGSSPSSISPTTTIPGGGGGGGPHLIATTALTPTFSPSTSIISSGFAPHPAPPEAPLLTRRRTLPGVVFVEETIVEEDGEGEGEGGEDCD